MERDILMEIAGARNRYRREEQRQVFKLTGKTRHAPLVPFFAEPGLICEIKRRSPSRGRIIGDSSIDEILETYIHGGAHRFSILTEADSFGGSCEDLFRLKQKHPEYAFLRKDFLLSREDITESYFLGADAVLLIGELLDLPLLESLTREAHRYNLQVLTEVHSLKLAKAVLSSASDAQSRPDALGINSRDLRDFTVNTKIPFAAAGSFGTTIPLIFESGVHEEMTVRLAGSSGFHGVLIGEACMRSGSQTVKHYIEAFKKGAEGPPALFSRLMARYRRRPLVKICGITRREDAQAAVRLGADILGFVLAPSPRSISLEDLASFSDVDALKCAVVQNPDEQMVQVLRDRIQEGQIHGVQLHGSESPELASQFQGNACKALVLGPSGLSPASEAYGPFTLIDLPKERHASTLADIPDEKLLHQNFLAGGITPELLPEILGRFNPLLIDIASGIESSPGIKDHRKMEQLFTILEKTYG